MIQSSIRFPGQEQGTEELELSVYGGDKVRDYVTLIQSSIRFPGQEQGTEELELSLYGGDKVGDYVTLIQSSIRFPGQEQGTEELELSLYGGDKVGYYVTWIQCSIRSPGQEQGTEELELSLYGGDKVGDYVILIQSSIRFPGKEQGTEELELSLYGGVKVIDSIPKTLLCNGHQFLAHLNHRLTRLTYRMGLEPVSLHPYVCPHLETYMSLGRRKPTICICENKDADQRLCFRHSDRTIPLQLVSKVSSFYLYSVTVQPGLCRTWSETQTVGFLMHRLIYLGDQ